MSLSIFLFCLLESRAFNLSRAGCGEAWRSWCLSMEEGELESLWISKGNKTEMWCLCLCKRDFSSCKDKVHTASPTNHKSKCLVLWGQLQLWLKVSFCSPMLCLPDSLASLIPSCLPLLHFLLKTKQNKTKKKLTDSVYFSLFQIFHSVCDNSWGRGGGQGGG